MPREIKSMPREIMRTDAFFSYNRAYRQIVERLYRVLSDVGLRVWMDTQDADGESWEDSVERIIRTAPCAVAFVGANGIKRWASMEISGFMHEVHERGAWIVPTLLPGASGYENVPVLLRRFNWVDLRAWSSTNSRPVRDMVAAILNVRPALVPTGKLTRKTISRLRATRTRSRKAR